MTLKIRPEDLKVLREAIAPHDTGAKRLAYLRGDFPRAEHCTNLDKRYRWDLLYASGLKIGDGAGVVGDLDLYAYLDDTHIDSALREIVPLLWSHGKTQASA